MSASAMSAPAMTASNASQQQQPEPEFKHFMRLPAEIRTLIWKEVQQGFIHVLYPHCDQSRLTWTLVHGGVCRVVRGRHGPPLVSDLQRDKQNRTLWRRKFDSRLLACYESNQIANRQLGAAEQEAASAGRKPELVRLRGKLKPQWANYEALVSRPRERWYHFGNLEIDLLYLANIKGWDKHQSKGIPGHASILYSMRTRFIANPSISRLAVRTSPAALDSLDITSDHLMPDSDGVTLISAKHRLAIALGEWRSFRSLWIVVDLPVDSSWVVPNSPKEKRAGKKKRKFNHQRRISTILAGGIRNNTMIHRVSGERGFVAYSDAYEYAIRWFEENADQEGMEGGDTEDVERQKNKVERVIKVIREVIEFSQIGGGRSVEIRAVVDVSRGLVVHDNHLQLIDTSI
ncbi:hypothetical protein QBC43DRAFT_373612 [Cladorrhinum sp. PSN259]|nr:hypothetical protein QBC43DRAFT_373612 [Cladorrhinum sp. PSN259]